MKSLFARIATFAVVGLCLSSCGGGGGNSGSGGGGGGNNHTAAQWITMGEGALSTATSNLSDTTDLQTAVTDFQNSYNEQASGQAATGWAMAQSLLDANTLATAFGTTLRTTSQDDPLPARIANGLPISNFQNGVVSLPKLTSIFEVLPTTLMTETARRAQSRGINYNSIQTVISGVDTNLKSLLTYLTNTNIQGLETTPLTLTINGKACKIGAVEGYTLRSGLELLKGTTGMLIAYSASPGSFNLSKNFQSSYSTELGTSHIFAPSEYLPQGGFLSLLSASNVTGLGTEWLAAAADANSALAAITTRMGANSTGWAADVFGGSNYTSSAVSLAQLEISLFQAMLTQPQTYTITNDEGDTSQITVNLQAWIGPKAVPPADLQNFFPSFTAAVDPNGTQIDITEKSGSIGDPTFGGLISGLSNTGTNSLVLYQRNPFIPTSYSDEQVALAMFAFFSPNDLYNYASGSGGSGGTGQTAAPLVSIDWPARSKTSTVTGLSSALSVQITTTSYLNSQVSTVAVDRNSSPTEYTQSYSGGTALPLGKVHVSIKFYAQAGEQGTQVGDAETDAVLEDANGDLFTTGGQPLQNVTVDQTVRSVAITYNGVVVTSASVQARQSIQFGFIAYDANNDMVAVSDGSEYFTSENPSIATCTPTGQATGLEVTTVNIDCAIDNVSSSLVLTITPGPIPPVATLSWGARTRDISLNSALSATVQVTNGTITANGEGDRPQTLSATTSTVTTDSSIQPGPVSVTVTFYDQPGGNGDVVGSYSNTNVTLNNDGTLSAAGQPLVIASQTVVIGSITLNQPPSIKVNGTYQLTFTAYDQNGNQLTGVTEGSASYNISNTTVVQLAQPYGLLVGKKAGVATVTCTIDGVTSNPVGVTVTN